MPKGNAKPSPIVARPSEPMRGEMAQACEDYGKSQTQLVVDLWRLHKADLLDAWRREREIYEGS